jgi:hypothetical protein
MSTYIYGIASTEQHPKFNRVGVMKFLYESKEFQEKENYKMSIEHTTPIREHWRGKVIPMYVRFEGYEEIYLYRAKTPIWRDNAEHKMTLVDA